MRMGLVKIILADMQRNSKVEEDGQIEEDGKVKEDRRLKRIRRFIRNNIMTNTILQTSVCNAAETVGRYQEICSP